jgi:hypothetical protein
MKLKIAEAKYYGWDIDPNNGTEVSQYLDSEIRDGRLFYNGIYNLILPDKFQGKQKRLMIKGKFKNKIFTRFYIENEKIDLPFDLGEDAKNWWEKTWIQIVYLIGALAGIAGIIIVYLKK